MTQSDHPATPTWTPALAARAVARGQDLDATLDRLLRDAAGGVGAEVVALFLWRPGGEALELAASLGIAQAERAQLEADVASTAEHPIALAARSAVPVIGRADVRADGTSTVAADLPLVVTTDGIDEPLGVVSFGWPAPHAIDDVDRAVLETAAELAALAVDRARLASLASERADWMARIATADALTGLANRRTLDRVLELEIERAKRQDSDISIAVFDVDGFRALNERAGSRAGDTVLRTVAAVLAEQVRLVDTIARIGGDEFAVVAPGSGGVTVADRILRAIEALDGVDGVPVTISAGVARFPADGTTADELLQAALGALEGARASGRGAIAEVRAD